MKKRMARTGKYTQKESPYKGVYWSKDMSCWEVVFYSKITGRIHLGYFPDTDEGKIAAAKAQDEQAYRTFKTKAKLNFPEDMAMYQAQFSQPLIAESLSEG